ncbi:MAG: glycosyltransferase [Acidobacteriota bacterium]
MTSPQVSIVIPTYNSSRYLVNALDSVLAQTVSDFEVLVVDDGSTDDTEFVMRNYEPRVRYIRQQNAGVAVARNNGISESRGRYVAFLDADDVWLPFKLERQLETLNLNSANGACYSAFSVVTSELQPVELNQSQRSGSLLESLLTGGNVVGTPSTVICERELLSEVGGFDPTLSYGADWDLWLRLAVVTGFCYVEEPLVMYRQHDANMSRSVSLVESDSLRVLEKGFEIQGLSESLRAKRRAAFARNYMVLAGTYLHARRYGDSLRCAARSVSMDFRQLTYVIRFPKRLMKRARPQPAV